MKKINFLLITFFLIILNNKLFANSNISLQKYLEDKDIENSNTQIYLLNRCSSIYTYASAVILKTDPINSKKFIEIANNLLFKSIELRIIENKEKLEIAKKKAEEVRKKIFKNYTIDGKKNWDKNKSYFKESYITQDMLICSKLVGEK
jgi:intein/homing endonuclease|tara:strand:+ start:75 stop:518 length:444 start_codon:yes stop_codon:yes gene_type:complete